MLAAVLKNTGDIHDLEKNLVPEDVPVPEINEEEVLIKVISASLNHRDLWIAKGKYAKIKLPVILGSDCSGVVSAAGKAVKKIKEGDEVLINPGFFWGDNEEYQSREFRILGMPDNGTFAEFVKSDYRNVFLKPRNLSYEEASAIPLAGVTAFRAVSVKANVKAGENVLISGIGGGVASFALLFALNYDANVFATSSDDNKIKKAISLGAKYGVNYKKENYPEEMYEMANRKIDVVLTGTGGRDISKYADICSAGGRIVCYGATFGNANDSSMHKVYWKQLKILGTTMGSPKDFSEMLKYMENKKLKPVIDSEFSLSNLNAAFQKMNDGHQFGKIIIKP